MESILDFDRVYTDGFGVPVVLGVIHESTYISWDLKFMSFFWGGDKNLGPLKTP